MMNEFLANFAEAVILAAVPIIVPLVIGWLFRKYQNATREIDSGLDWALRTAASIAVQAAEQSGLADLISDKKTYAIEVAEKHLVAAGLTGIDLDLIGAAIEAAVYENFTSKDE